MLRIAVLVDIYNLHNAVIAIWPGACHVIFPGAPHPRAKARYCLPFSMSFTKISISGEYWHIPVEARSLSANRAPEKIRIGNRLSGLIMTS